VIFLVSLKHLLIGAAMIVTIVLLIGVLRKSQ